MADGSLHAELLMAEFQGFCRRHSEHWRNRFAYEEAWPQLLLQAYLQRVVNGGGRIEFVVECKVVREHDGLDSVLAEGVEQTARYVDRCAAEAGHLVVFDRRENRSWEEKIFRTRRRSAHLQRGGDAVPVAVWGM